MNDRRGIRLRPAGCGDFGALWRLKCEASNVYWSGHDSPPARENFAAWYETLPAGREILLAECDGDVVGYLYVDAVDAVDEGRAKEVSIGVGEAYRGRAFAQAMLEALVSDRAVEFRAWIFEDNEPSIKAFERAGFVRDDNVSPRLLRRADRADGVMQAFWRCRSRQ